MEVSDYRALQQRIRLTLSGTVPEQPEIFTPDEQDAVLDRLACTWDFIEQVGSLSRQRRRTPTSVTCAQKWAANRRWDASHHAFIPLCALTGHCLDQAIKEKSSAGAFKWSNLAAQLRSCCGSLFIYGIDFEPCAAIYCGTIRADMPPGFSGFWIRERHHCLQPAMARFLDAFPRGYQPAEIRSAWDRADTRYHALHQVSMHRAVEDGKSLAQIYRTLNGQSHTITDLEFETYDRHFGLDRDHEADRCDYIFQMADTFERIATDLITGHGLETDVIADLLDGMKAAISVFGIWIGPVRESSRFYPRALRGE